MIVLILISIISLLFSFLYSTGKFDSGLKLSFLVIIVFTSIRHDIGNDYWSYFDRFEYYVQSFTLQDIYNSLYNIKEVGWIFLNLLCAPLGWHFLIALVTIITQFSFYLFIKNYTPRKWAWIAMFIYLFNPMYFLLSLSMLRQGLSIALFLYAYPFIEKKRIIPSSILIILAISIHHSAIILLPIFIISFLNLKNGHLFSLAFLSIFLVTFIFKDITNNILMTVLNSSEYISDYSNYIGGGTNTFGVGTLLSMIPFAICLLYISNKSISTTDRLQAIICTTGTLTIPFEDIIPLLSRVTLYFSCFTLCVIPKSYCNIVHNKIIRNAFLFIYIITCIYRYLDFWSPNSVYYDYFSTYHTIFELL